MNLPTVGDVYETALSDLRVLLCIRVKDNRFINAQMYEFLVLDGGHPPIRSWSTFASDYSMKTTMEKFKFVKIA